MDIHGTLKNIIYSFGGNIFSLLVSIMMVLFVPKFMSIEAYGMWQLFLFYFSYLGFSSLGWQDGIYLKYAGKKFEELDEKLFSGQFLALVLMTILEIIVLIFATNIWIVDSIKRNVLICSFSVMVFLHFNACCNYILQITNKITTYARLLFIERGTFALFVVISILTGATQFFNLFIARFISLLCTTIISAWICRRLIQWRFYSVKEIINEAFSNINVGVKLMFANIASMLIIGIVRYGISMEWSVATFGRVSLILNISNFFLVFITSVSIVFFPILKHMSEERLPEVYELIRTVLSISLLGLLIIYYPLKEILEWWLPQYADSLHYMIVLFPICLFESKMNLLINTYLKSLRKEKLLFRINITSVFISALVTIATVKVFHNLELAVFSITVLYAFRCEFAEWCMQSILKIQLNKAMIGELMMICLFMGIGYLLNDWISIVVYGIGYSIYLLINRKKISLIIQRIKSLVA